MAHKLIVLTGLPPRSALNWDESELLQPPLPPFYQRRPSEERGSLVRWRSLAPVQAPVFKSTTEGASFFAMDTIQRYSGEPVSLDADETALSEFYDQSFALHEGIHRSFTSATKSFTDDSDLTGSFGDESHDDSTSKLPLSQHDGTSPDVQRVQGHLSDVEDIPSATYLQSVAPRTVLVNLIVAIISIPPRRRVRTRWGREMDVVELLVGDETKSGFRVSCWVPPSNEHAMVVPSKSLEESLKALQLRDVILLRSIALASFRGQVYGQSLRQNMTKIDVLDREIISSTGIDESTAGGLGEAKRSHPQAMKVRRVRRWIRNFVTPGAASNENANGSLLIPRPAGTMLLPPDSQ
ncbi:predicted protein [Uncinocarpus reesii 1704]|uniref:Uncharacterized protein n=1 Tax=Uncinocarpus reesii (strain UAMH 1704) TaxID=336963 RepID=C4JS62_UNCRE|nr:uncharacterized protein UREG_05301 [Uncinocarpus reesii 1704]EEP80459.1 predicted protein [Uncinocarpus reesii 1704]